MLARLHGPRPHHHDHSITSCGPGSWVLQFDEEYELDESQMMRGGLLTSRGKALAGIVVYHRTNTSDGEVEQPDGTKE